VNIYMYTYMYPLIYTNSKYRYVYTCKNMYTYMYIYVYTYKYTIPSIYLSSLKSPFLNNKTPPILTAEMSLSNCIPLSSKQNRNKLDKLLDYEYCREIVFLSVKLIQLFFVEYEKIKITFFS
jgi:hypothetical protein